MKLSALMFMLVLSFSSFAQRTFREPRQLRSGLGVLIFKNGNILGIIDSATNKVLLPAEYTFIKEDTKGLLIVEKGRFQGLYHARLRRLIIPSVYHDVHIYDLAHSDKENDSTFLVRVTQNRLNGVLNHAGGQLLPLEYTSIEPAYQSFIITKDKKKGVYFIYKGMENIPVVYDHIRQDFVSGCFIANIGAKYSLFDQDGNVVSRDQNKIDGYNDVLNDRAYPTVIVVDSVGQQSLYDGRKRAYLLSGKYDWIGPNNLNQFIVKQNGKFGIVAVGDKIVIPFKYDTLAYVRSPGAITWMKASRKGRYALLTLTNKPLTKFKYRDIDANGPIFTVKADKGYTMIDSMGRPIRSATYDRIGMFVKDRSRVVLQGKVGYINTKGVVTSAIDQPNTARGYSTLEDLYNGFAKIMKSGDEAALTEFCRDLTPDAYTIEFIKRTGLKDSENYSADPDRILARYTDSIHDFRDMYRREIKTLRFLRMEHGTMEYSNDGPFPLLTTDDLAVFEIGGREISIYLGSPLIYVDGYWKSFSPPYIGM